MAKSYNQELVRVLLAIESNLLGFLLGLNTYKFIRAQYQYQNDSQFFIIGLSLLILSFLVSLYFVKMNVKLATAIKHEDWEYCFKYIKPKCYQLVLYFAIAIWCASFIKMVIVQFIYALVLEALVMAQLWGFAKFDMELEQTAIGTRAPESEIELDEVVVVDENEDSANNDQDPKFHYPSPPPPYYSVN